MHQHEITYADHYLQGLNPGPGSLVKNLLEELRSSRAVNGAAEINDIELLARCRSAAQDVFKKWTTVGINPTDVQAVTDFYRDLDLYCFELIGFEIDAPASRQDQMKGFRDLLLRLKTKTPHHSQTGFRGLDYGCGVGTTGIYLTSHGLACDYADVSRPNLEFVRERLTRRGISDAKVIDLNSERPVPNSYDYVLGFDVLEHVANPAEVLKELVGYLRPGGVLIFNLVIHEEPGSPHLLSDAYLLRKLIRGYGTGFVARVGEFKVYKKKTRPDWLNAVIGKIDTVFWNYRARRDSRREARKHE